MIEDFRPLSSLSAFTKFHDGWDRLRPRFTLNFAIIESVSVFPDQQNHCSTHLNKVAYTDNKTPTASVRKG